MKTVMLLIALQAGIAGDASPTLGATAFCSDRAPAVREGGANDTTFVRGAARPPAQRRTTAPPRSPQVIDVLPGLQTGAVAPRRAAARPIAAPRDSASGLPSGR